MIKDPYRLSADSPISPAQKCFEITPADGANLASATKAIYVGTGGDIVLTPLDDTQPIAFRNLADGSILDVRAKTVEATGTTASDLVGLV